MNPYFQALLASNSKGDLENITLRVTYGKETALSSLSWFNAYKTSEYPEVVCDRDYFFLYGTDHDENAGGIYWGKGNNLNLSDFSEQAKIIDGHQTETPYLIRVPLEENPDTEVLHLFYHTNIYDPDNNGFQQTRLITSAGGVELHLMNWTDRGKPLGILPEENHTGYFMPYRKGVNDWIGTHITRGGLPQPWYYSIATHPRNWTRGSQIDVINGTTNNFFAQLSEGVYFDYLGQQWWLGQIHPDVGTVTGDDRILIIAKSETRFNAPIQQDVLNYEEKNIRHSVYIDGDIAHVYFTNPVSKMYHGTYDLRNLQNYL